MKIYNTLEENIERYALTSKEQEIYTGETLLLRHYETQEAFEETKKLLEKFGVVADVEGQFTDNSYFLVFWE